MPATRRKTKFNSSVNDNKVDMETSNQNNSHSVTSEPKQRKLDKAETSRGRKSDQENNVMDKKSKKNVQKISFHEDDDEVDMEVQGNITSDDEDYASDSESDGEIQSESNEESKHDESYVEEEHAQMVTESENSQNESTDEEEIQRKLQERQKKKKGKCEKRVSMEKKLDTLSSNLQAMQDMMLQKGFFMEKPDKTGDSKRSDTRSDRGGKTNENSDNESDITIYQNAVRKVTQDNSDKQVQVTVDPEKSFKVIRKRDSLSSEDKIDTSDELIEVDNFRDDVHSHFIAECQAQAANQQRDEARPGPSLGESE